MIKNRLRFWLLTITALLVAANLVLYVAGQTARNQLAKQYPAPGKMVTVQGHRLHVHCEGQGPVTVLLEAGLNEFSLQWHRLQPLLANKTKTCAYDRAGLGWSEPASNAPTLDSAVNDLRAVLQSIDTKQPIVLVGHSYGTILVRLYAQRHPDNIKAIVLLDPASENMPERILGYKEVLDGAAAQFKDLVTLASIGLIARSTDNIPVAQLQGEVVTQYRAVLASGHFFEGAAAETGEMINNLHRMQQASKQAFPNIPVIIISRGQPESIPGLPEASARTLEPTWTQLQNELVTKLHAKHLIADKSGHNIQLTQPEWVFEAIQPFITHQQN